MLSNRTGGGVQQKGAAPLDRSVVPAKVLIYFWDERDGPKFNGWWFGPKAQHGGIFEFGPAMGGGGPSPLFFWLAGARDAGNEKWNDPKTIPELASSIRESPDSLPQVTGKRSKMDEMDLTSPV